MNWRGTKCCEFESYLTYFTRFQHVYSPLKTCPCLANCYLQDWKAETRNKSFADTGKIKKTRSSWIKRVSYWYSHPWTLTLFLSSMEGRKHLGCYQSLHGIGTTYFLEEVEAFKCKRIAPNTVLRFCTLNLHNPSHSTRKIMAVLLHIILTELRVYLPVSYQLKC